MAAGDRARSFQDEVTCAVCLEYFTDPVTIECGHNFCQACISQCWGESEPNFSCPQCRETAQQRNLRPNRQLGNLAELVKRLRLQAVTEPEGQQVCERHQEALKLFCEEDQRPSVWCVTDPGLTALTRWFPSRRLPRSTGSKF